ncbi:MAG TPA: hypothetical protein PLQ81_13730 [bacterium]|nr:hypothetical protein [bacterium]
MNQTDSILKLRKEIKIMPEKDNDYTKKIGDSYYNHDTFQMHVNRKRKNRIKNRIARMSRRVNRG